MSLQDRAAQQAAAAQAQNNTQPQQAPRAAAPRTQRTFGGWGSAVNRTFGRVQTSKVIQDHIDVFNDIISKEEAYRDGQYNYKLIPLDANESGGYLGSIIVTRTEQNVTAAVTLLLGKTCVPLSDVETTRRTDSMGNQVGGVTTIPRVPGDVYQGKVFQIALNKKLQEYFPNQSVVSLGATLIPADIDPVKDTNVMFNVLARAFDATEMYLNAAEVFESGSLVLSDDQLPLDVARLHVVARFRQSDSVDIVNRPIRTDVQVETQVRVGNGDPDQGGEISPVVRTEGYMDVFWEGQKPDSRETTWTPNNIATFIPAYVITNIELGSQQRGFSLSHLALSIASLSTLAQRNSWLSAFAQDKTRPWKSTASLAKFVPLTGTPITPDGSDQVLDKYEDPDHIFFAQNAIYQDNLIFMIDVEESGVNTPHFSMLLDLADGQGKTMELLIKEWDRLTRGHFSKRWNAAGRPALFSGLDLRIPTGRAEVSATSGIVDTRVMDNIFVATNEESLEDIAEHDDAYYGTLTNGEYRTEKIVRYQRSRTTPAYDMYVRRIKIEAVTVELLLHAFVDCGYELGTDPNLEIDRRTSPRGTNRGNLSQGFGFGNGNTYGIRVEHRNGGGYTGRGWANVRSAYSR